MIMMTSGRTGRTGRTTGGQPDNISLSIYYIYIYMYMYIYMCIHIYIYIYVFMSLCIHTSQPDSRTAEHGSRAYISRFL